MAADATAADSCARNSSWTDSCTMSVPSEVQRCPAVPKPENSAPSTASAMSALGVTTIGFLPPSSRQGACRWRPASSPMRDPTAVEPVNPILSIAPACSPSSRPANASWPSAKTMLSTPSGKPAAWIRSNSAMAEAAAYSAGFQTTVLPATSAGMRYQDGTATGKFPAVRTATAPTLTEEEVAGIDDLLDLAQRFRVGLAKLARHQAGEGILVGLDDAADGASYPAANRRWDIRPGRLRALGRRARGGEGRCVGECDLGDHIRGPGGVR